MEDSAKFYVQLIKHTCAYFGIVIMFAFFKVIEFGSVKKVEEIEMKPKKHKSHRYYSKAERAARKHLD